MSLERILTVILLTLSTIGATAQDDDWAQFGRYAEANAAAQSGARAVFMGDSITDIWAQQDPDFFTLNDFVGRGISGQTTSQMLVRFRRDVIDLRPQVVVIMAGTNDIARNGGYISPENTLGNLISMCELARANGIAVILCSIPPASRFWSREGIEPAAKVVELNAMIRDYAGRNSIPYLDYHSRLVGEDGGIPPRWSEDTCHPNAECYRTVMEPMVLDAVYGLQKRIDESK